MPKTNKTPAQILEEAKAKLASAEQRVAREAAKDDPRIVQMAEFLDDLNQDINANSRQLNGPNSFENRLTAQRRRALWIATQRDLVEAQDNVLRLQKEAIQAEIDALSESIANGEDPYLNVEDFLNNLPSQDMSDLIDAEAEAKEAWKESTPEAIRKREQAEKKAAKESEASA